MAVASYLVAETVVKRNVDVVAYVDEVQEAVIAAAVYYIPGAVGTRSQYAVGNGICLEDGPVGIFTVPPDTAMPLPSDDLRSIFTS